MTRTLRSGLLAGALLVPVVLSGANAPSVGATGRSPQPTGRSPRPTNPAADGAWSVPMDLDLQAIHQLHLPTGKILFWAKGSAATHNSRTRLYDPATGEQRDLVAEHTALFCGGQAGLPDGRVIVAGGSHSAKEGTEGLTREVGVFDPWTETWRRVADMQCIRWYPSVTTMADGRVIVFNGQRGDTRCADAPEVYDPAADTWTTLGVTKAYPNYPRVFVDPRGDLALLGKGQVPWIFRPATSTFRRLPNSIAGGAAAMYLPGKVIKSGADNISKLSPTNLAAVIDLNADAPAFRAVAPMHVKRSRHTMKVLPTGEVLVVGGFDEHNLPVLTPEIWNPDTETWRLAAPMSVRRLYHHATVLWRDGRVLAAGGEATRTESESGEWFSPDYLFRGPRPVIAAAPGAVTYGTPFLVESHDAHDVARISLLRLDAPTHAFDGNQRFMWLPFTRDGEHGLRVEAPPDANIAPPGYYQLFLLNGAGVPSVSAYLRVGAPAGLDAHDDAYGTEMDVPLAVAAPGVLANDAGTGTLAAQIVDGPTSGTLDLRADGSFTYTPAEGFMGDDAFSYRVVAGLESSEPATVRIAVQPPHVPPHAADDAYDMAQGGILDVAAPGLLANDTGAEGATLTAVLADPPADGTLMLHGNGSFTYTPAPDFNGTDQFTYSVTDGHGESAPATVTIEVAPAGDGAGPRQRAARYTAPGCSTSPCSTASRSR